MSADLLNADYEVRYLKSNHFRTVLAEGCYGGVSPRGLIRSTFYHERSPLPDSSSVAIVDGLPGAETFPDSKAALVRELEVEVVMDLGTAISYALWLKEKIEVVRQGLNVDDAAWATMTQGKL